MSLKDEVNAALIELSKAPNLLIWRWIPLVFAVFTCLFRQFSSSCIKGSGIDVQISPTGKFFSLTTPLAVIQEAPPSAFMKRFCSVSLCRTSGRGPVSPFL
ncbi:MAG: hypothetical protein M5U34_04785 [Chloroflexi bacterium]|nr:hypothetical protein [Chloroflexota bacterium]